jgi:ATP-dependent 26S proteasome regulatory subunit
MILEQIQLGSPAVWIKSDDIYRISDYILLSGLRNFYSIAPDLGFSQYIDGQWKQVLIDFPFPDDPSQTIQKTTFDFSLAYEYLKTNNLFSTSSFIHIISGDPNPFMQAFGGVFANGGYSYRNAFFNDNLDQSPLQHVIISFSDCPEEYSSVFTVVESEPLSAPEMAQILNHLHTVSDGMIIDIEDSNEIIKSALGLSEFAFINLCLTSVIKNGKVSSKYIYDQKMSKIKQHGILEIIKPKMSFDQIGGLDMAKDLIKRNVWLWNNPDEAAKFGVQPIRRMLMVGIPGTGKSAICEATANELNLDLARTGVSQVMNSFVGQSEANMRAVFKQINAMAPLCVWIDEFGRDMSGGASSSHVDGGTTDRVHGEFLTGLQELPNNVFLICAANQLEHLKPEMLRAERFDKIMFVGLPSHQERKDILSIYLRDIETTHQYDYDALAHATTGFTGAEIKSLIKEVKFYVVSTDLRPIDTKDIVDYAPCMRNILWIKSRQMIVDLYKYALEQWDFASSSQMAESSDIINGTYGSSRVVQNKTNKKSYTW